MNDKSLCLVVDFEAGIDGTCTDCDEYFSNHRLEYSIFMHMIEATIVINPNRKYRPIFVKELRHEVDITD